MNLTDTALVAGATARLTRLVVADDLGEWWVKAPVYTAIHRHAERHPGFDIVKAYNYAGGLSCPFCVGFWIGTGVLAVTAATSPRSLSGRAWRFGLAALSLNYVTAHVGARLGDTADEPEG